MEEATLGRIAPVDEANQASDGFRTADPSDAEDMFGAKTAALTGGSLSVDIEEADQREAMRRDDERMQKAAMPADWQVDLAVLSFDERVTRTIECLQRRESFHGILYGLLKFCEEERSYDEIEQYIPSFSEFEENRQSARRYVFFMQRTGALEEIEYDEAGAIVTAETKEDALAAGIPQEEVDELAVDWRVVTTDVGREAVRIDDPKARLCELLGEKESRLSTYGKLLQFCAVPRQLADISNYLADDPGLEIDPKTGVIGMQPNAYIGKLSQAGGLVWRDGWVATEEGAQMAATMA